MIFSNYCDECGERLNTESGCVVFKHLAYDTLLFCNDDCCNDFMLKHTFDAFIDKRGRLIED